ncbi:methyltransferase type 12 [Tsukamurella tyrosinosolvens]|nr:methyltransferase type 12 [Tsukamurella tyrosinosolvens]KZL97033.1 methyltransferase type 12 [Tsukamurella tyrosinosolvens]
MSRQGRSRFADVAITPDTKDWTWVIERPCAACGFDPSTVRRDDIADRIARSAVGWDAALARPEARDRPDEATWSVLEYGCHLRDVHRIMRERLGLMLAQDGAAFANWDQDATAVEDAYGEQDPATVAAELAAEAAAFAAAYRTVGDDDWARTGLRSNGSAFTVESFAIYALHDLEHHRVDVGLAARPAD